MAILFIASEAYELKPFAALLTAVRSLKWPIDYAEEGIWEGQRAILVANGAGPKLASEAVEVARRAIMLSDLSASRLDAVVSVGVCGGLNPDRKPNDIIVATTVLAPETNNSFACHLPGPRERAGVITGTVVSIDHVAITPGEKTGLRELGADAVEMEAAGVAAKALHLGVPFLCIKAVSDSFDETMPLDMNRMRTPEGRFARGKIGNYAVTHPQILPGLLRLKRRADDAAAALGDFLASCQIQPDRLAGIAAARTTGDDSALGEQSSA
jgi:adenosylhomocysteine nucleosidase